MYYMYVSQADTSPDASLVISHDGKAVPPKPNELDAATLPGFYTPSGPDEQRYLLERIVIHGANVAFSTELKNETRFTFHGAVSEETDAELHVTSPIFTGQLKMSKYGKTVWVRRVKLLHAIVA